MGKPYEGELLNLREGAQFKPEFTRVNPKSKVPTLVRDDGSVLPEFPAIAYWLAVSNPQAQLLPADAEGQPRGLEAIGYVVLPLHMHGISRTVRPVKHTPSEAGPDAGK